MPALMAPAKHSKNGGLVKDGGSLTNMTGTLSSFCSSVLVRSLRCSSRQASIALGIAAMRFAMSAS